MINGHDNGWVGGNIDCAVVVAVGCLRSTAFEEGGGSLDGIVNEGADILEDGHGLFAINDVLDGSLFSILTGNSVAGDISIGSEGISNRAGGAVVGGEDEDIALGIGAIGGEVGLSKGLGGVEVPVGGDLTDDGGLFVAGQSSFVLEGNSFGRVGDDESAIGDLGLENIPGAFEEEEGIVVGGSAGIQIKGIAGTGGIVDQVLSLGSANGDAVEGDVEVYGLGVADQAVIGDDLYAGSAGGFSGGTSGSAILGGKDDDFDTIGNEGFNVGLFLGGVALAEEDLNVVAGSCQGFGEAGFILHPAWFVFCGEDNADR